jgi:hypothetical protein
MRLLTMDNLSQFILRRAVVPPVKIAPPRLTGLHIKKALQRHFSEMLNRNPPGRESPRTDHHRQNFMETGSGRAGEIAHHQQGCRHG